MENELLKAGWQLDPDEGFVGHVGGIWSRKVDGVNQFAFVARDFHANSNGVVHGGMLMTFIDRAMGHTARGTTGAVRCATISLSHQFLAPARIGDLVEMTPQMARSSARTAFVTGTAFVGDAPVVSAQGVWRVSHTA